MKSIGPFVAPDLFISPEMVVWPVMPHLHHAEHGKAPTVSADSSRIQQMSRKTLPIAMQCSALSPVCGERFHLRADREREARWLTLADSYS